MKKCECGCGEQAKRRFVSGHNSRNMPKDVRDKIANTLTGNKHAEDTCRKISEGHKGKKNYQWKKNGYRKCREYIWIYLDNHPSGMRAIREHWLVIEKYFGRLPKSPEEVHHANEDRKDNRIENLMLFSNHGCHMGFHRKIDKIKDIEGLVFDGRKHE